MSKKLRALLLVFVSGLLLDQGTKVWTVANLRYRGPALDDTARAGLAALGHSPSNPPEATLVPGFLSFVHAQNPAAAMGMMLGFEHRMLVFAVMTLVALVALGLMYRALSPDDGVPAASLGFILAGAIGNAIDRVHKGTVTDMVKVYWDYEPGKSWLVSHLGTNQYYTWNVADALIFVGVGVYVIHYLFQRDTEAEDVGAGPEIEGRA